VFRSLFSCHVHELGLECRIINNLDSVIEKLELILFQLVTDKHLSYHVLLNHDCNLFSKFFVLLNDVPDSQVAILVHLKERCSDSLDGVVQGHVIVLKRPDLLPVINLEYFQHLSNIKWIRKSSILLQDLANTGEELAEFLFKGLKSELRHILLVSDHQLKLVEV